MGERELEKRVGELRELLIYSLVYDELLYMVLLERLLSLFKGTPFVKASSRGDPRRATCTATSSLFSQRSRSGGAWQLAPRVPWRLR